MGKKSLRVSKSDEGDVLVRFLARKLDISGKKAKGLLDQRAVFVNSRRVWMARHRLRPGDSVEVEGPRDAGGGSGRPDIIHCDKACIVVDKPAGTLSTGPTSSETLLRKDLRDDGIVAVHRIDRDTSGCLLLARSPEAREALIESFRAGRVRKTYRVLVQGAMTREQGSIRTPIDGKSAITHLRVLCAGQTASYVQVRIETGRTHQIRKHLASIGHTVIGDRTFATGPVQADDVRRVQRQMLHAIALAFPHPTQPHDVRAQSPLPRDFQQAMRALGLT